MLDDLSSWHWLILAALLLIGEMLGAAGFLLGAALSALLVAGLVALQWLSGWQGQLLWFSLAGIAFSLAYWKLFRRFNHQSQAPLLNDRAAQLIGRQLELSADLVAGEGRTLIGDTLWRVKAEQPLSTGTVVRVVATEQMVLLIEPILTGNK